MEDASSPGREPRSRAGLELQRERPEDVGARGGAEAGSTPLLAEVPTEEGGVLEVEVLAGERPVPGANVRLYWRGARDPILDEVAWRLASTGTTDARGQARLASRPGSYLVAVHAEGHAPLRRQVQRPYGEERTRVRLVLEPGHPLTGRTVVAGTNEPLPLVELVLSVRPDSPDILFRHDAPAEERVYASSNERGDFRVEGLSSGEYLLEARAPGHARQVLRKVVIPAAAPLTVALQVAGVIEGFVVDAQERPVANAEVEVRGSTPQSATTGEGGGFSVEVGAGSHFLSARRGDEAGSVDKPLFVRAGQTVRDVRIRLGAGAVLEGRVVARATGAAVAGASVSVMPNSHFVRAGSTGSNGDAGRTVTDASGLFALKSLAPGGYDLVVDAPGYSRLTRKGVMVAAGERFPLELQLEGTGTVEGHVRDTAGAPLAGARVGGGLRWAGSRGSSTAEALTDAQGYYRLGGLNLGQMYLTAHLEGVALGVSHLVDVKEDETARVDFTFERTGILEGVVRTEQGSPPAEPLSVRVYSVELPPHARSALDSTGRFRMTLPVGAYRVVLVSDSDLLKGERRTHEVKIEAGRTVQLEMVWREASSPLIKGLVLEPDGAPSPFARVVLSGELFPDEGGSMGTSTDEEGRFVYRFYKSPKAGLLTVTARNGGRSGETRQAIAQGDQEVVVKLRTGASVRGRVVRADGQPVRGFTVGVHVPLKSSAPSRFTREFSGERFDLPDVPAEPLTLMVRTVDGAVGTAHVSPVEGKTAEVEVSVAPGSSVRGRVVDATTNAPLAHAALRLKEQQEFFVETTVDGRFALKDLSPGEGTLEIFAGSEPNEHRVKLVRGQTLDVGDVPVRRPPDDDAPR
ncbi:carboxypeptidase regulatory-like domain-containing protein [Cystobacter fuscus]|uniref:carboxypeptidase regulatory-like domain-containing protein n=1 Tax=Cystobacter fuscus TaxID=43 RepID=UPI0037C143ED